MVHRIWLDIRISTRRPRHAPEHHPRHFAGGASRGRPRCGAHGTAICWPSTSCCCVRLDAVRRTSPPSCSVRALAYRTVHAYRAGTLGWEHDNQGQLLPRVRTTVLLPTLRRSLLALLKVPRGHMGVPHALEQCHAGPDPAGQMEDHRVGRDDAALAPRGWLGMEVPSWWPKTTTHNG